MSKNDIGDILRQSVSPSGENSRVLALWEWHRNDVASDIFNSHAKPLAQNGVTDLFLELPIWLNPVIDAYLDGKISPEDFRDHYVRPALNFPEEADRFVETINAAHANGIDVLCVNGRKTRERAIEETSRVDPDRKIDMEARKRAIECADQWRESYPEDLRYEKMADAMHMHNVPNDTIAATLVREKLGSENKKGVIIYGAAHFAGAVDHKKWTETDGILDEALEAQGITVFNIETLMNRDDLISFERIADSFKCQTATTQDVTYFADTDEVVASSHQPHNPFGLRVENGEDLDFCWGAIMKPVSELYDREELNPYVDAQTGWDIIQANETGGPSPTPVSSKPPMRREK